jgi:CRISPR-associated protein Csx17
MNDLRLAGCRTAPLAHYLKALGILRLVSEQADPEALGWWEADAFMLRSRLTEFELVEFFSSTVAPTPIVGPWNGSSGFFPKDSKEGIAAIEASIDARFARYREAIACAHTVVRRLGLTEKPDKEMKPRLIEALRAELPDDAVQWIDSALALTAEGPKFPPLLGTGGNDGHLDFTNNQMQRWADLLLRDAPPPRAWLRSALFDEPSADLPRGNAIGQFHPAGAGGANMAASFDRASLVNPWSFVLMLEGALLFASSITRRLEDVRAGALVYPFTVRASGVGYASASLADEESSRNEVWLPEWSRPSRLRELQVLFAEGRARVRAGTGTRPADTAVDFARAIQDLGTQRGVRRFTRFAFQKRQGLSYLAVPLGAWEPRSSAQGDWLAPMDGWLQTFRRGVKRDGAPASMRRALTRVEGAVLDVCARPTAETAQALLVALGAAEHAMATSKRFTKEAFLRPVHGVGAEWIERADDGSVEWRLAVALAAAGLRASLVPVRHGTWAETDDGLTVWGGGDLVSNLRKVLRRRSLERGDEASSSSSSLFASAADIAAFVEGAVDDGRLAALLRAASLIDLRGVAPRTLRGPGEYVHRIPPYAFALCALVWGRTIPLTARGADAVNLPVAPAVAARLLADDGAGAVAAAQRRLTASGLRLRASSQTHVAVAARETRRIAAALLFPLSRTTRRQLINLVLAQAEDLSETP